MKRALLIFVSMAALQGCAVQEPFSFNYGDFFSANELPYDSPPQVIYRIDDHRFLTLEKYRDCNLGETYYNDSKLGIRQKLARGLVENFQGRVINADPTGMNLVFPTAEPPRSVCNDRGCNVFLFYSSDGGSTFHVLQYMNSFRPTEDSKKYTVVVTREGFYVAEAIQDDAYVIHYSLKRSSGPAQSDAVRIERETFSASNRPHFMAGLRSPSGQDRFICNASIKPSNPNAPLK